MTSYLEKVKKHASNTVSDLTNLLELFQRSQRGRMRLACISEKSNINPNSVQDLIKYAENETQVGKNVVCIIENISSSCIEALDNAWSIDPRFFNLHASNRAASELWQKPDWALDETFEDSKWNILDGIFEFRNTKLDPLRSQEGNNYNRHVFEMNDFGRKLYVSTRISYIRVSNHLYLFLTDPPFTALQSVPNTGERTYPELRFPYGKNYRGVYWPHQRQDIGRPWVSVFEACIPFDVLAVRLRSDWQRQYLFSTQGAIPSTALVYLILGSLWESKLRTIERQLREISFADIRRPELATADKLHDLRRELYTSRNHISDTKLYVPAEVGVYFSGNHRNGPERSAIQNLYSPTAKLDTMLIEADKQHALIIETFELLMSTISILESKASVLQSRASIEQTKQSVLLTKLAAVYLPISTATGIFGMNLAEINNAAPKFWAFLVILFCFMGLTYLAYKWGPQWKNDVYEALGDDL